MKILRFAARILTILAAIFLLQISMEWGVPNRGVLPENEALAMTRPPKRKKVNNRKCRKLPEPSTMILIGSGIAAAGAGYFILRSRKRK